MPSLTMQMAGGRVVWAWSAWHRCWSIARCKGGAAMKRLMESWMLLLARLQRLITGQR